VRIVFMGSPQFALPALEALSEARHDIRLVVTQPDRRAGRGRGLVPTPVKLWARRHELPLLEFARGEHHGVAEAVLAQRPEAIVVVAFGQILREPLLSAPALGCLNVHASLLPRWRGVAPIPFAILHGDAWTGVTIMRMDAGVDTGPVLAQQAVPIHPEETAQELSERLAGVGADLLVHTLRRFQQGRVELQPQGDQGAVYAPKLTRALAPVRWDRAVLQVHNQIRGLQPYPGATSFLQEHLLKITAARPYSFRTVDQEPGTVLEVVDEGIVVVCGEGLLLLTGLQNPGRKPLPVSHFLRGHAIQPGQVFRS
jgi:methionyl-tRNA formyltransferase